MKIYRMIILAIISIPQDSSSHCFGDSVILTASAKGSRITYQWDTGDTTDTIRVVGITGGCSSVDSADITFGNPTGIITTRIEPLDIYPNPAHQTVSVSFHGNGMPATLEIFDASGKRIYRKKQPACSGNCSAKFDVSNLESGVYYVWLYNEAKSYFSKMVVQ